MIEAMIRNSKYFRIYREKMVGANLYAWNIEPIFELWPERYILVDIIGGSTVIWSRYKGTIYVLRTIKCRMKNLGSSLKLGGNTDHRFALSW